MDENQIGKMVVDSAIRIHQKVGPGLLESAYEAILFYELSKLNVNVQRQVAVPIDYEGIQLDEGYRADLIVEDKVIIELKSLEQLNKAHMKQLLTYLRMKKLKLGYLLNFGSGLMRDGIKRIVNGL